MTDAVFDVNATALFRAARSGSVEVGGISTGELPLDTLADLLNRALGFYDSFTREYDEQRRG